MSRVRSRAARLVPTLTLGILAACSSKVTSMTDAQLRSFATDYTAAWCGQVASKVAAHFTSNGSLTINAGTPAVGRDAITASAQSFMTAFPDMVVAMDSVKLTADGHAVYHWTLSGTNTGPTGTGKKVRFSGYEEWTLADGLVAQSLGHYNQAEYEQQLKNGVDTPAPR